jgi:hypothetical protein
MLWNFDFVVASLARTKSTTEEKNNSTHWCKSRAKTGVQEPHGMFSEHVWFTFLRVNVFERL